jgi:hypothetical protein
VRLLGTEDAVALAELLLASAAAVEIAFVAL